MAMDVMPGAQKITIALGTQLRTGAFGGGNQFAHALKKYLEAQGHRVTPTLTDPAIDIILLTEPRPWSASSAFDIVQALTYQKQHPNARIVHRINECDERKGRPFKLHNQLLCATATSADAVIFVSQWLQGLHKAQCPALKNQSTVIHSAADAQWFNSKGTATWNATEPLRIVTHHWAPNWRKGWDVYQKLDSLINEKLYDRVTFTVIGRTPPDVALQKTTILKPLSGKQLAAELKQHHVYISASLNEPAGMHYIEALQCGLPILYRTSGSLPEYCRGYGIAFDGPDDIEQALTAMIREYTHHKEAMTHFTYTAKDMGKRYEEVFQQTLKKPLHLRKQALLTLRARQAALWLRDTLT